MDGIHWENREISECPDSLVQAHIAVRQLGDCVEQAQEEELGDEREERGEEERREGGSICKQFQLGHLEANGTTICMQAKAVDDQRYGRQNRNKTQNKLGSEHFTDIQE